MHRPNVDDAPGIAWRKRKDGWVAVWVAYTKGFEPRSQMLQRFTAQPSADEIVHLRSQCVALQAQMLAWASSPNRPATFDGKFRGLIRAYQTDPDSPYHAVRYATRKHYDRTLKILEREIGGRPLDKVGGRDFKKWHEAWRWPKGKEGVDRTYTAHERITMLRTVISFGAAFEIEGIRKGRISECSRLKAILGEMTFKVGQPRTEAMTLQQCQAVIKEAHHRGKHSLALAQAFQFELALRQRDVIGEWVPMSEPGVSEVTHAGQKWIRGLRWEEISADLILTHAMSKSRSGKVLQFDLKLYPLVMAELARIPRRLSGPVVVQEGLNKPWKSNNFNHRWREIADNAGLPKTLRNMDSRAGGTTEAIEATGGDLEAARKQAGHSDSRTTQRYSRDVLKSNSKVAILRVKGRAAKNES